MPGQSARLHAVAVLSQSTLSGGFGFAFAIVCYYLSLELVIPLIHSLYGSIA